MRVRSPIGDMPFTLTGVRRDGTTVVIEGELGSWHSEISVEPADLPMLARTVRVPLLAAGGALVLLCLLARLR